MELMRLSIKQTYAQIGIQTHLASQEIHSQAGDLSIQQPAAKVDIESPPGELIIDSSEAWAALGKGPHLEWMNAIYSQSKGIALQAIAKRVEDGNRMTRITNHENAFAELAQDAVQQKNPIEYAGEPSYFNVKVQYQPHAPMINIEPQQAKIEYTPNKPDIQYHPGSVDVYVQQKNAIDIQVSNYDWYI